MYRMLHDVYTHERILEQLKLHFNDGEINRIMKNITANYQAIEDMIYLFDDVVLHTRAKVTTNLMKIYIKMFSMIYL